MEMSGSELEDDLFFADLSKQISLLIMDDDDDDHDYEDPLANTKSVSLQKAFSHAIIHPPIQAQFVVYDHQSCRRESKGTGVFIPQSTLPRRKQRQARFNNNNNNSYHAKSQRQQQQQVGHDNTKLVVVSHHQQVVASNASFNSTYGRT